MMCHSKCSINKIFIFYISFLIRQAAAVVAG
jgi:hypothetical protein